MKLRRTRTGGGADRASRLRSVWRAAAIGCAGSVGIAPDAPAKGHGIADIADDRVVAAADAPDTTRAVDRPAAHDARAARGSAAEVIETSRAILLDLQDGNEWPYEGVYRVRRAIPYGYRVGGTAIAADALMRLPGFDEDGPRREAVERATAFIVGAVDHPDMAHAFTGTYDVRGWGYTYGLRHLLHVRRMRGDAALGEAGDRAVRFYLKGIAATAIPESGGWNYARRAGFDAPGAVSPFMTSCTLQALFEAQSQGFDVDASMVDLALDALERARTVTGGYVYAGRAGGRRNEPVPGAVGRMVSAEVALTMAGRSSPQRLRGAVDAFFAHWERLEERRARTGTHVAPFGVAPYYFFYAHYYAAQAIALLPPIERPEYRRKLHDRLMQVRDEDGSWNDRVFRRSAAYGTAMAIDALGRTEFFPDPATSP